MLIQYDCSQPIIPLGGINTSCVFNYGNLCIPLDWHVRQHAPPPSNIRRAGDEYRNSLSRLLYPLADRKESSDPFSVVSF